MSERSGQSHRLMEEEKKRFDNQIDTIEKKISSKYDRDDASSKNNS